MATYSPQLAGQVGQLFSQLVPGFPSGLASTWATLESGVGNNPYGVTVKNAAGNWVLGTYPTLQAGVQAAAKLLLTAPQYSSVRAAVRSGDPNAVASALVASPWNTPGSPYYAAGFTAAGYHIDLSSVPSPVGQASPAPTTPAGGNAGGATGPSYRGLGPNTVQQNTAPDSTSANTSSIQSLPGQAVSALFGNFAWVPNVAVALTVIVVVLGLGKMGVDRLLPAD